MFQRITSLSLVFAFAILLAGCGTTGSSPEAAQTPAPADSFVENYLTLKQGMSAGAVREKFGEPEEITPFVVDGMESHIWKYSNKLETQVKMTTTGTYEEWYFDVFANRLEKRDVPIQGTERNEVVATIELLFYEETLVSWKDRIDRRRIEY